MNINNYGLLFYSFIFLFISVGYGLQANASVVMSGTRIIYNAADKSRDIQLKNRDGFPYVVTTWFDNGNVDDGPEKSATVPFLATPPVFRIQANEGQIIRLVSTQVQSLPKDRESLFYFNFMQVPPSNIGEAQNESSKQNGILILLRNRVKLFYRPSGLSGNPQKVLENIKVARTTKGNKTGVTITNNQPYHITVAALTPSGTSSIWQRENDMIAPFSHETFFFSGGRISEASGIRISLINDQGARISEHFSF